MPHTIVSDRPVFLSTAPPTRADRGLALAVVAVSLLIFLLIAPYARVQWPRHMAFVSIYGTMIIFSDSVAAAILFIEFNILRSRALLMLACGYLFTALMAVSQLLTFPGLFSPSGLLAADSQSAVWLYVFWHAGFPIAVMLYALLKHRDGDTPAKLNRLAVVWSIVAVVGAVLALTLLATVGDGLLPQLLAGNAKGANMNVAIRIDMALSLGALLLLWVRRPHSTLDLWLMVVACVWLFDMGLSSLLNGARFDVGFYIGRVYGLLAGNFVLVILLQEAATLYTQLAKLFEAEHVGRRREMEKRRRKEAELAEHEERERLFIAAVQSSFDAIVTKTIDGTITGWNPAAERLFGFTASEAIGRSIEIIVPEERRAELRDILSRVGRGEFVDHHETERRAKSGKRLELSLSISPIRSPAGEIIGACKIARDVSEKKRIERMKDEFIATVSHELRTPVTTITGPLGLLAGGAAGELPASVKRLVEMAHSNSMRLMHLVNDILDIEKIESGTAPFRFARVELRPLIDRAVEANRPLAEKFGVPVRVVPGADAAVCSDAVRLQQVIANLLSNAVKFSSPGEHVVISVEARDDYVRLAVRDRGPGVPEEYKSLIYEKFAQVDATDARQKGGNGLGLSIAKQTILRLGGSVGHVAAAEGGTIFFIDVPRWSDEPKVQRVVEGACASA